MTAALPLLPRQETVLIRLIRISTFGLSAFFEPVFRALDLSENAFHVLCLLVASEEGQASPSELSELVGTTRANMTRILEELIEAGYVSRSVQSRDGRRHVIRITAAGRRATTEAMPRVAAPVKRLFSGLTAEEQRTLDRLLRKAIVSFDAGAVPLRAAA
ncbi:MAG: MarR family transcriptional regulator [Pseudomonadota bacterium]